MRDAREIILSIACALVVFGAAESVSAQDWPVPTLVDEVFQAPACDEMLARIDRFYAFLHKEEAEEGLVEITGSHEHLIEKLRMVVRFVPGGSQRGGVIKPTVTVVRGEDEGEARMRFWSIQVSESRPVVTPTRWDLTIPKGTKPFYFHSDYDNTCGYPMVYPVLKELLAANPHLRINAVVSQRNPRGYRKEVKQIRETLGPASKGRIRFFRSKDTYALGTEFWLLP